MRNIHFLASRDEINGILIKKKMNFLFIIYKFKRSSDFLHYVRTLRHIQGAKNLVHHSGLHFSSRTGMWL